MEDTYAPRTRAENEAIADEKGCVIRDPGPRELLIDIDSDDALQRFFRSFAVLREFETVGTPGWLATPSPSGLPGHYHVVVTLSRDIVDMRERVLLQACLGSDPLREMLSLKYLARGSAPDAISFLFEKAAAT